MKTANATVHYAGNEFMIGISPSGHALTMDFNGQRSASVSPLELLLIAVGGCTGADVISILNKKREKVTDYRIELHGDRREEHPRSFKRIEVKHILRGHNLSKEAVEHAIALSDQKYCSVSATLRPTAEIVMTYEIHEDA